MRKLALWVLPVALLVTIGIGCGHHDKTAPAAGTSDIIRHMKAAPDLGTKPAPYDGTYVLVARADDSVVWPNVTLAKGDEVGFKTAETGKVTAVAGKEEKVIPDASYEWIYKPSK